MHTGSSGHYINIPYQEYQYPDYKQRQAMAIASALLYLAPTGIENSAPQ
jgi:hypothetical protein